MSAPKPFEIPKILVWEAYQRVRANGGAAGVDGQSIPDFEADICLRFIMCKQSLYGILQCIPQRLCQIRWYPDRNINRL